MITCLGNCCLPGCLLWCLWWCFFVLSFFPRGVLDEILNLIESVSEDFPSYSLAPRIYYNIMLFEFKYAGACWNFVRLTKFQHALAYMRILRKGSYVLENKRAVISLYGGGCAVAVSTCNCTLHSPIATNNKANGSYNNGQHYWWMDLAVCNWH